MTTKIPNVEEVEKSTTKSLFDSIVRFEPLSRDQWEKIKRAFTAVQAITAGLNFVDHRYGAGVIDEHTKCVWTRSGMRVVLWYSHGTQGATLSKEPDPNRPELPK